MRKVWLLVALVACSEQEFVVPVPREAPVSVAKPAVRDAAPEDEPTGRKRYVVHFSPKGGCTETVVELIDSAKSEIRLQAYSFTSKPITDALVRAVVRKVDVKVILDSSNAGTKYLLPLQEGSVPFWLDAKHPIAHNKVLMVDGKTVETGSFNYTAQAENGNAENCLVVKDQDLTQQYLENWNAHLTHSKQ